MTPKVDRPRPERDQTDESLRTERDNTDKVMAEGRTAVQTKADELVERAREQADAVLETARERADKQMKTAAAGAPVSAAVVTSRAVEDEVLQGERATADEILERERKDQARILAKLLPLEREKTDRFLLTERLRSDEALAHRDDFMGMVSHDLRNLLGGVLMTSTLLSEEVSSSEDGRLAVIATTRIQRYVARMNRLIGDLIDVVSIDAGKLSIQAERGDGTALLTEIVDLFGSAAAEKNIALECRLPTGPLMASFDHERMLQVLANLVTNAVKFTPQGGHIAVRGEQEENNLHFTVSDTGQGIPETMLTAVFERFWQAGSKDKRGYGLGLYISRSIVEAHGGRIWTESKLGEGSVFHFTIPALAAQTA